MIRETVDDLVARLFGGDAMPLMQHLVEETNFSEQDIQKLRELLNCPEGDSNDS